jgi:dipeptidyl aminopeptidase/acylaminoacyl peptidase
MLLSLLGLLLLNPAGGDSLIKAGDYLDLEQVSNPQISPDGKTILYTRSWIDKINDRWEDAIWVVNADGTKNRFLVNGSSPIWSPDGTRIAYVASAESPKGAQIFVRWMDAEGATSQITRLTEGPRGIKWSPDGKSIGFSSFVPKRTEWQIPLPPAPPNAKWTPAPRVVDRLHYRVDRAGLTEPGSLHLFVVPADGGSARQNTAGEWSTGVSYDGIRFSANWDWMPDGKTILFDGLVEGNDDLLLQDANIYAVDLTSLKVKRLTPDRGLWTKPVVSPDGKLVAFVGHPYFAETMHTSDLYVMSADGTGIRNISKGFDRDPGFFGNGTVAWAADGSGLYFSPDDRGSRNVVFAPVTGSGVKPVTSGIQMLNLGSVSKSGVMVGVKTTFQAPDEVVRITVGPKGAEISQVTEVNQDFLTGKRLATAEEIWYPSTGGARIQGWIVKPPDFDPSKKYPMLLEIHGGPQGMYNVGFDMMWQLFAASGYVVLYTNPRGSTGYGNAVMTAIEKNYPGPDYDDLMAGVDTVLGRGYVDPKRLYVSGCSGGGKLSSWVIGHTTRFAGAAVRCPITNWISFAGGADVPLFAHSFFAKPFWEDPAPWLAKSSLMYVGKVTTPTLLMTGVMDMRTPIPQSEEFFAALKMRGIPTAILRFEGEWHGTESIPSNWMRTMLYMMSWFDRYGGKPAA